MVMMQDDGGTPVEQMDLVGGDVCLDLVNTGSARRTGPFRDKLRDFGDLVTWARRVGLVGPELEQRLRGRAACEPEAAAAVLDRARHLRERVYRVFSALAEGEAAPACDLEALSAEARAAAAERSLAPVEDGFAWVWPDDDRLERLLWPPALAAAELLVSDALPRVKECASDDCSWLFLDVSRNRSRRWCDMRECGNRAKARRFSARKRNER